MPSQRNPKYLVIVLPLILFVSPFAHAGFLSQTRPLNYNWRHDALDDVTPAVAMDDSGHCVAVWQAGGWDGTRYHDYDIYTSNSCDYGKTWSRRSVLNSNKDVDYAGPVRVDGGHQNRFPAITTDGRGTWLCVWEWNGPIGESKVVGNNILVARSKDNGATWSPAKGVNTDYESPGVQTEPQIASDQHGKWICVWMAPYEDSGDYFLGVFGATSCDDGRSWSDPILLSNRGQKALFWAPKVLTDCNGLWIVTWMRSAETGGIEYAISTNAGVKWTTPSHLSFIIDSWSDEQYSIATDRKGGWMVVLCNFSQNIFGVYETHSSDNAASWSIPALVSPPRSGNVIGGDIPAVAADGTGRWVVVWLRSVEDFYYESVFREVSGDFSDWSRVKPIHKRDSWTKSFRMHPVLTANRNGNWLAMWTWRDYHPPSSEYDIDICFSTGGIN